ncbi:MAG: hypothetical protein ACI81V_000134 [Lentimonas sp.]|jgi:hypothetical protein
MNETWAWISGWAIAPERFKAAVEQALPEAHHLVFAPTADAVQQVLKSKATHVAGYSLGSLLLLNAVDRFPTKTKLYCLAPFLAFCKEAELGGNTPEASLIAIQKRLEQTPEKALKLFYRLSGITATVPETLPYSLPDLIWGLEALRTLQANESAAQQAIALIGTKDALIEHHVGCNDWSKSYLVDASHCYIELLHYFVRPIM